MVFAKIALQLADRRARKKVGSIIRIVSEGSFGKGELRRHTKRIDDCKRIFASCSNKELAGDDFTKKTVKSKNYSSVLGALLYKKEFFAALQRQMAMSSPQDVFYSLQDVLEETEHPVGMLHGQRHNGRCKKG